MKMERVKISAGVLLYRRQDGVLQVLLGHMGGPFWARKDAGAWTIPKGEIDAGEGLLMAARREFTEEVGQELPDETAGYIDLGQVKQSGGKKVQIFALEGEWSGQLASNTFAMEYPPKSGRTQTFPELDRAEWFSLERAKEKIVRGQLLFLERLVGFSS